MHSGALLGAAESSLALLGAPWRRGSAPKIPPAPCSRSAKVRCGSAPSAKERQGAPRSAKERSRFLVRHLPFCHPITPLYKYQTFFGLSSKIEYT